MRENSNGYNTLFVNRKNIYATIQRQCNFRVWINNPRHFQNNASPVIPTLLKLDEHQLTKADYDPLKNHPRVNSLQ